jgi:hypothetical protein
MFRSLSFHSRCPSKLYHKLIVMRTSLCRCRTSVDFSAPVSPSTSCSSLRRCPPPPPVVEVLDYVADGVRYRGREPGVVEYLPIMETEVDALPTVISDSDSSNRVRLVNNTYKEMVGQLECLWILRYT